jgi:hypothetical protein
MSGGLKAWPTEARTLDEVLIGDGYVYRGFVAAVPRKHGAFQYAFRPMLPAEVTVVQAQVNKLTEEGKSDQAEALVAKTISEHVTWNSANGKALTAKEVNQLPNPVYNAVYLQIIGVREMDEGYDKDPEDSLTASQQLAADIKN